MSIACSESNYLVMNDLSTSGSQMKACMRLKLIMLSCIKVTIMGRKPILSYIKSSRNTTVNASDILSFLNPMSVPKTRIDRMQ